MINTVDWTEYAGTYYVETVDGKVYDKISGNRPIEAAKVIKKDAVRCKKEESTIAVISNAWRFEDTNPRWNYYK